jgi:hypothetical protein
VSIRWSGAKLERLRNRSDVLSKPETAKRMVSSFFKVKVTEGGHSCG